jgi:acetoin utilization deacetylase AcuC-like enzyme/formylglycine-generating enzyme required for sulfatase activity
MKGTSRTAVDIANCEGKRSTARLLVVVVVVLLCQSCQRVEPGVSGPSELTTVTEKAEVVITDTGFEMVLIPAGRFRMGSAGVERDEEPVHEVSVDAFLMDRYEVTQEQWAKLAGRSEFLAADPSHFKGPDRPVEMVSWDLAALYCNVRSRAEGLEACYDEETGECNFDANGYRLPTEAEWEYACRAGSDGDFLFGSEPRHLKQYAWYAENAAKRTHPVGQKKPNAWGLYDMHGNVAEWCNDHYDEDYYQTSPKENPTGPAEAEQYVLRGGAWNCTANACRSARRVGEDPGFADACFARDAIGFRCVRKAPKESPVEHTANYRPTSNTGLVYDDIYLEHKTGPGHPERPERLRVIKRRLEESNLLGQLTLVKPRKASLDWITSVHRPDYVERVKRSCEDGVGWVDSPDAMASDESYEVALIAVGGVLAAVDAVVAGEINNAFCAVRPPGHHALPNHAMGFCLFNNIAIAARYLQKKHKIPKILIVDWDVHHGNGTQDIFYGDPTVLYFSVHQYPFYPGTGGQSEKGEGEGLGFTINAPLPAGSGDEQYREVFEKLLKPAAYDFDPDFVLISAGFDAHEADLLGGMNVTTESFAEMTRLVKRIADDCCEGRLVSLLEGGYGLEGLAQSVEAHVRVLVD